jgi:methionyl-tRNA formyltransferase
MNILFLGNSKSPLVDWLRSMGDRVAVTQNPIVVSPLFDFIISYGYRCIIKKEILSCYDGCAINLHISYLPWNRGADPNFWSFVDDTPKGVTIHYLDEGIDTGDIIVQKRVEFTDDDTLRTSYDKLQSEIQKLFKENWLNIRAGQCNRTKQVGIGSYHKSSDKNDLTVFQGWDTPVLLLEEYAADIQMAREFFK